MEREINFLMDLLRNDYGITKKEASQDDLLGSILAPLEDATKDTPKYTWKHQGNVHNEWYSTEEEVLEILRVKLGYKQEPNFTPRFMARVIYNLGLGPVYKDLGEVEGVPDQAYSLAVCLAEEHFKKIGIFDKKWEEVRILPCW